MEKNEFKLMWEDMQKAGYFSNHPHYSDHYGQEPTEQEQELDNKLLALDFSTNDICMPVPYSDALERSVKRTEAIWLNQMFSLPKAGVALDIGCGFGRSVSWMCQQYDQVIGTDISAEVISTARQRCAELENAVFYVNEADSLPAEIEPNSIDVAYIFTVFQHVPREYALEILKNAERVLKKDGQVVFNLIANINENVNDGKIDTEWAIGYSEEQALALLEQANLKLNKIVKWFRPETETCWLWVSAFSE
ncbi:MAG: hypothetical protein COA96_14755 [SAR86 cluster bacterium]|uniref:Methyltransferase type 11 domain-containing protein n=1 Tax=SAR86 cluster bacterium TaxID=2030880 RepID=A0A2A5AU82_9GAMM|nr:MAG: hypothetical protein COA96_14755 [SAR86 cluster bacterium]